MNSKRRVQEKIKNKINNMGRIDSQEKDKKIEKEIKTMAKRSLNRWNNKKTRIGVIHDFEREGTLDDAREGSMVSIEAMGNYYLKIGEKAEAIKMYESSFAHFAYTDFFEKNVSHLVDLYKKREENPEYLEKRENLKYSIQYFKEVINEKNDWSSIKKPVIIIIAALITVLLLRIPVVLPFIIKYFLETIIITLVFLIPAFILKKLLKVSNGVVIFIYIIFYIAMKYGVAGLMMPKVIKVALEYIKIIKIVLYIIGIIDIIVCLFIIFINSAKILLGGAYKEKVETAYKDVINCLEDCYKYLKLRILIMNNVGMKDNQIFKEYLDYYNKLYKRFMVDTKNIDKKLMKCFKNANR